MIRLYKIVGHNSWSHCPISLIYILYIHYRPTISTISAMQNRIVAVVPSSAFCNGFGKSSSPSTNHTFGVFLGLWLWPTFFASDPIRYLQLLFEPFFCSRAKVFQSEQEVELLNCDHGDAPGLDVCGWCVDLGMEGHPFMPVTSIWTLCIV